MDHVAIMDPAWKLIPKILSGEKVIESRWYHMRRAPWNKINIGDYIFFKDSGKPVTIQAEVSKVTQFEIKSLKDTERIVQKYGKKICLINPNVATWKKCPKYCMLMWLKNPTSITPFSINKKGFGAGAAWITVDNVNKIKL